VPPIDLFTVNLVTLVTILSVSLWTMLAWKTNRSVAGMQQFSVGLLTMSFGSVLLFARLVIPGKEIIVIHNVFVVGGMMVMVQGIRKFRVLRPFTATAITTFTVITSAPFLYWLYVHENYGMRVGIISTALAFLSVVSTLSMARRVHADDRLTYWPTALAFALATVFMTARAIAGFTGHYGANFLTPVPFEMGLAVLNDVGYIGCSFGMLLASNTQMRQTAEQMAFFDPLTSLPNRRLLLDRLLEAEHRALESRWQFGVIYLDLDGFKLVNDTLGHEAGDELLRTVSMAMTPMLRPGDCLARVGGDEFVVLAEDVKGRAEVAMLARRLKSSVEGVAIPGYGDGRARVSCGIALFPQDGRTAHDVMREADTAMYHAKRQRRLPGRAATAGAL
jgi:diguanylate cyclase (GGDEF)-like protein